MRKMARGLLGDFLFVAAAPFSKMVQLGRVILLLTVPVLAVSACGAFAAESGDLEICSKESGDLAIKACDNVINSGTPQDRMIAYVNRSVEFIRVGKFKLAIEDLKAVTAENQNYAPAFYIIGNAYVGMHSYEEALNSYDTAINIDNNYIDALNSRCYLNNILGRYTPAIQDCTKVININGAQSRFFVGRGNAYLNRASDKHSRSDSASTDDYADAFNDYSKALALDHNDISALLGLSRVYLEQGKLFGSPDKYLAAIKELDKAVNLAPDNSTAKVTALNNRCWALAVLGNFEPALKDCNYALKLLPNDPSSLDSLAFIYLKQCELDKAIATYDLALMVDSKRANSLYGRGVAGKMTHDAEGERYIERAREINRKVDDDFRGYGLPLDSTVACSRRSNASPDNAANARGR